MHSKGAGIIAEAAFVCRMLRNHIDEKENPSERHDVFAREMLEP